MVETQHGYDPGPVMPAVLLGDQRLTVRCDSVFEWVLGSSIICDCLALLSCTPCCCMHAGISLTESAGPTH
jgi:hypothetical protein